MSTMPKMLLVDFTKVEQNDVEDKISNDPKNKYLRDYDESTTIHYRSHRANKTDPITHEDLKEDSCFKFEFMWDPYTGNRLNKDPYGPLYLNPINLLRHFYQNRLNKLWMDGEDGFEGTFSDGAGSGENIEIPSRGIYPECYLFRLPIPDCYLKKEHSMSLITMGPILTNREICELDRLIKKFWSADRFFHRIYKKIGSLYRLKCHYDIALAKNPIDSDLSGVDIGSRDEATKQDNPNLYLNFKAIEVIRDMV